MNILTKTAAAALLSVSTLALAPAAPALAETVLRLDEVAVGNSIRQRHRTTPTRS